MRGKQITLSLLDRLMDDRPDKATDGIYATRHMLNHFCEGVRRDLENLLNTRCRSWSCPEHCDELDMSLMNYGIPDFTARVLSSKSSQNEFCDTLKNIIQRYEPRFKTLDVRLRSEHEDNVLRFRIEGTVWVESMTETMIFDSGFNRESHRFTVASAEAL